MKLNLFSLLVILSYIWSCKKEDNKKAVSAGMYDSTFNYHKFNPALHVNLTFDSILNTKNGSYSMDIDLDGKIDLVIQQQILLDKITQNYLTNANYPYCRIILKNGLEVATKTETYPIGLGQTSSVDWVDTIQYKTRIDPISSWTETDSRVWWWMWVAPYTPFWGTHGCWYNLNNTEKYIGIGMKVGSRYKYGWMKVIENSLENMQFISYAIEK